MKVKSLTHLLTTYGNCIENSSEFVVAEGNAVTLYVGVGGEALAVAAVIKLKIDDEILVATNEKEEVYAVAIEDIRSLRFGKSTVKKRTGLF